MKCLDVEVTQRWYLRLLYTDASYIYNSSNLMRFTHYLNNCTLKCFFSFGFMPLFLPCYAPCVMSASARVCLLLAHTRSADWRENTEPTKRLFLVLPRGKLTALTATRVSHLWDRIYDSDVSIFDHECHIYYIFWSQHQDSWIGEGCRYFQNKTMTSTADIWK